MNKKDISFQLYTARKFQPYKEIFEYIESTGIKNIELFALTDFDQNELKDLLQQHNLITMSAHISFESLETLEDTIKKIKFLNIKHAIIPAPKAKNGKDFEEFFNLNESEWIDFAKQLSNHIKIFQDNGLTLGYHNHSFEFIQLPSGKYPMELILDQDENLKFEIDLGWSIAGKANPIKWIEKYKNRIIACHLKDFYSSDDMLKHSNQSSIGEGFINWKELLNKISTTKCEVIAIEHDDPKDYKEYINKSLDFLTKI
ncbi:MAG: hypothetical protein CBD97_03605 [Pelagibacteraceae bacterium TMED237]|nr:MAG: hypothetical protein CBD97_03605 [Pelagibacteraceae bacterium TMED237]|tara:strand:- start:6010 stop:6780 length:771 start_codon:yes stop_codon:yes gene_type:complete